MNRVFSGFAYQGQEDVSRQQPLKLRCLRTRMGNAISGAVWMVCAHRFGDRREYSTSLHGWNKMNDQKRSE